ncbi:MAG: hypothetical protein VB079_02750 [Petrimonas sp.]|nr:hypothetical protein [Petrimonas sp.]
MIHYRNNGIGVKLIRKKRYQKDVTTEPIYWQVTYKRKSRLYSTGFSYTVEEWDDFLNKQLRKHKETKETLQNYFDETLKPLIKKFAERNSFSFAALERTLKRKDNENISVDEAFQDKIDSLIEDNKIGNSKIYTSAINALMKFKHYKRLRKNADKKAFIEKCIECKHITVGDKALKIKEKILFEEITPEFLTECEKFWLDIEIVYATIGINMRTLRAIIKNEEGEKPYLTDEAYPFGKKRGKYSIPEGGRREISLQVEDIWKIENYETDNNSLAIARDIFVFMFYGNGLNFGDVCRLRYENIDAASKEIVFLRKKTLREGEKPTFIYVPLLPPMVEIINRHGNKNQDGYIFPFLNGIEPISENEKQIKDAINLALTPINSSLKVIANKLELDPELSTSYTRNTYVTHLTSEMLINPIVVKKMVGHSTKKDVTAGYVNLNAKKRKEMNSKLLNPERKYTTIDSVKVVEIG